MTKRWLIRSLFLLPLVCVVGLWVTSWFGGISVTTELKTRIWWVDAVQGRVAFVEEPGSYPGPLFHYVRWATAKDMGVDPATSLGVFIGEYWGTGGSFEILLPLSLLTLLLLALNGFVWRETKPKNIGRAFPLEPNPQSGESKP